MILKVQCIVHDKRHQCYQLLNLEARSHKVDICVLNLTNTCRYFVKLVYPTQSFHRESNEMTKLTEAKIPLNI